MAADTRFTIITVLRAVVATVLYPAERALQLPVEALGSGGHYLMGLQRARAEADSAQRALATQSERALRLEQLSAENQKLRALLQLRPALAVAAQGAEILYEAPDVFSRKVIIDRGSRRGIALASPVIDDAGVLGQVTRVYLYTSEVTLLTDKDAAIPVLNSRTSQRGAAFGLTGGAGMELRFMAGNADVRPGDLLTTSGVDGIYPQGIPVARVSQVDRKGEASFARVLLTPVALPDSARQVLVLTPIGQQLPPRPEAASDAAASAPSSASGAAATSWETTTKRRGRR